MGRPVRTVLFVIALLVSAGLGYRAMDDERTLAKARQDGATLDLAAEEALSALLDARGSMYAYVAPNQGTTFWGPRVGTLLDTLGKRVVTLDAATAAGGGSLAEALDGIDQLTAADKRARQYAERRELLLAGDVLFTEVRDLLNSITEQVVIARSRLRTDADRQVARLRQEQAALAVGGVALWFIVALVLLPGGAKPKAVDPDAWRHELADTLKKSAPTAEEPDALQRNLVEAAFAREGGPPLPVELPVEPSLPITSVQSVAEICADMSALTDIGALSGALERASQVIGAKGLIVWVAANDGSTLSPVATHGFDPRVVARIGSINRDSANLTAEALRENTPKTSAAQGSTSAAIAVPMCGPTGPVGVLSAELQPGHAADSGAVALASIFAAQLATLTAPLPQTMAPDTASDVAPNRESAAS